METLTHFQEDVLGDVLQSIHLHRTLYCRAKMGAPWGFRVSGREVASFHIVTSGSCWLTVDGMEESVLLTEGDLVILPHGHAHTMTDHPKSPVTMLEDLKPKQPVEKDGMFYSIGQGAVTTLVCGGLELEDYSTNPLYSILPAFIHMRSKENSMNMKQDEPWDITQHASMPRPKDDDGYFEQMSRAVFLAGLNWKVIEKKWPDIKRLFANFSIDEIAQFDDGDIDRLLKDDGMIRSAKKISAVVANAQTMQKVEQEFGSFANYLQAVKAKSEDALLKDLHKRFAFLGESTSVIFLFSVGEEIPETMKRIQATHGTR